MKYLLYFALLSGLMLSCTDDNLMNDHLDQDTELSLRSPSCHDFPPNKVLATFSEYEMEILESNSDFINDIYIIQGGTATYLANDDELGKIVCLPTVKRGQEIIFEIRVNDPDGNPIGDIWQSGPGSRNADGSIHAIIQRCPGNEFKVSFEDIPSSGWVGDEPNYIDAIFQLRRKS